MKKTLKLLTLIITFIGTATFIAGCSQSTSSTKNNKITVTATTDFYGEVAKAVVGNKGHVTSVINNPSVDPHDYEPTSKIAKEVANSNVLVANGVGYDGWMSKLAKNAS
ncbi:metal ABC transporter solute-binding protein, Zn/Mn family, partial [Lactiplantibacillus plantarum]|uniref:metal ABC transporter solute-binding protein, Zn/Mn family n=1 Tax=Lactiplantibacillus plantarum TaxID=1590 RepID=UPI0021C7C2E0